MEILSEFGAYLYENIYDIKNHAIKLLRVEFANNETKYVANGGYMWDISEIFNTFGQKTT